MLRGVYKHILKTVGDVNLGSNKRYYFSLGWSDENAWNGFSFSQNIAVKDVKHHLSVKLHTFIRRVASCKVITSQFNEFERLTELKTFFSQNEPSMQL